MEWSRVVEFLVGMEQMTWSGVGTPDADWQSSFVLSYFDLVRCLMDIISVDSKLSTVLIYWSVTRR